MQLPNFQHDSKVSQKNGVALWQRPKNFLRRMLPRDLGQRVMFYQLWQERWMFFLLIFLMIVGAALEGLSVGLLIPFLDGLFSPDAPPWSTGIEWFDHWVLGVNAPVLERLYRVAGLILAVVVLNGGISYWAGYLKIRFRESILHRIRCQIIDQFHAVSLSFFSTTKVGNLINTMTSETKRLRNVINIAADMTAQVFVFLAYASTIVWISWELSIIALLLCGVVFGTMNRLLHKLRNSGRAIKRSNQAIASTTTDLLGGIRTINEFDTEDFEARRFAKTSKEARRVITKAGKREAIVGPITKSIASSVLIGIVIVGVQFLVMPGHMKMSALMAFLVALLRLIPTMKTINGMRAQWSVYSSAMDDIGDILRRDDKPYLHDGSRELDALRDGFELKNVSFGYEPGQRVLKNIDLHIPQGKITALLGGSGAGKSTLADLVARFHDPDEGAILLDGVDLREYKISSLRDKIAVVNQHTFLFNQTARFNIAYGLDDISEETLRQTAEKANALEFIEEMPDGFDTILGDRGARLSGGQRQRIAIARALLRNPEFLILDEATSSLDSVSENIVHESMEYLMQGRTVLVIAHRLSTVENADNVVVLEDGRIVEQGGYQELLDQKGQLWKYHSLQFEMAS